MPDVATLREVVANVSAASFALAFLAGFVLSFNPGSFTAVPVAVGYFASGARDPAHAFRLAGAFVAGMSAADVLLGVLFAAAGNYAVASIFGPRWGLVIGPVLLLLGLRWLNLVSFRLPVFAPKGRRTATYPGAFLLGLPFSLAVCPFCVPALVTILTVAAATGKVWYSAGLLLAYSLGRGLPVLAASTGLGAVEKMRGMERFVPWIEKGGGVALVLAGVYMVWSYAYPAWLIGRI